VGDVINYTFTVTNTGNVALSGVVLSDAKLGLTNAAVTPGTLAPAATGTATATYTITQADVNAGGIENTATVTGTPPNKPNGTPSTPVTDVSDTGTDGNATVIANPDVTESPKLNGTTDNDPTNDPTVLLLPKVKLVKIGVLSSATQISYTFTVTNTGNVTLTNLSIADPKLGLTNLIVSPNTLAPNAVGTATATYTITQADITTGEVKNTATVTGTPPSGPNVTDISDDGNELVDTPADPDTDPTNDPTVVLLPKVKLVKTALIAGTGAIGDVITYTFTVTNTGNVPLTGLSIADAKLNLTNLAVTPSTLAPGASGTATATYAVTQVDINAGEVKNTATVTGTPPSGPNVTDVSDSGDELVDTPADPDTDPTNDPTIVPLTPTPKVRIVKTAVLTGTGAIGDVINYTFTVTNTGNVPLTSLSIADAKLNLTNLAVTPSTLTPGASGTSTAAYILTQADITAGEVKNTASVTGTPPTGPPVTDISDDGDELVDTPADPDTDPTNDPTIIPLKANVVLLPKVYLQGSLFGVFSGSLMRDDLRSKNLIPRKSPYVTWSPITQADTITLNTVLAVTGADAIVDWVFVELRDAADSTKIVDSRSALVQRDGDIVDVDGTSSLKFTTATTAKYFVAVRHRNHLGVMSKTALPLSQIGTTIDFRLTTTPTYVLAASPIHQSQVDVVQGKALWAGNALYDNQVIYQGTDNDVNVVYQQVINATGNFFKLPFYILPGYYQGDINMDGEVIFQGTTNDVEYIYQNIINNHNGNGLKQNFFIIQEQLPK
jgi:hypothetical protein